MGREILPSHVYPLDYTVHLAPDLDELKFKGSVDIHLSVEKNTSIVVLNSLDLELANVSLTTGDGDDSTFIPVSQSIDIDKQRVSFAFPVELEAGSEAVLTIEFAGEIKDNYCGLYRSKNSVAGELQTVAATFMCPADCRRLFPCFDEPAIKSKFTFLVTVPKDLTVIANTSVVSETETGGIKTVKFGQTPKMATYIVALGIGNLSYVESTKFRVPVRIYATPGYEERCKYAADLAADTLEFFEQKFGIEYPLDKCDFLALQDSVVSAMENWGLITFKNTQILYAEGVDDISTKVRVTEVVQHELAHQWFGNLVTMDWWDGIWLNEGFATWMSWYATNSFFPEWKVWEQYVFSELQRCLKIDALPSSHAVQVPVSKASELGQIFDTISYSKGSAVLKMVANFIGEDSFLKGVSAYLAKHQFANTKTSDLWDALSDASGKNVTEIMDVWTKQVGYPVLKVTETSDSVMTITQTRFLSTGEPTAEQNLIYPVNLAIKTCNGIDPVQLNAREITLDLPEAYKLNGDQTGIYRVIYPAHRLASMLSSPLLSPEDRIGLISDASALAKSGHQSASVLLDIITHYAQSETEANVWAQILSSAGDLLSTFAFTESVASRLRQHFNRLVLPHAKKLGHTFVSSESMLSIRHKALVNSYALKSGDESFEKLALDLFAHRDTQAIDPNIRAAVYSAASSADASLFDTFVQINKNPKTPAESIEALVAIGRHEQNFDNALGLILDGTVRSTDALALVAGVGSSCKGMQALWDWMTSNYDKLVEIMTGFDLLSKIIIRAICEDSVTGFSSYETVSRVDEFFKNKDTSKIFMGLENAKNGVTARAQWVERDEKNLDQWLNDHA